MPTLHLAQNLKDSQSSKFMPWQADENALEKNKTYILSNTRILKESKRLAFFGAGQAKR